jgi:hypothetical protein
MCIYSFRNPAFFFLFGLSIVNWWTSSSASACMHARVSTYSCGTWVLIGEIWAFSQLRSWLDPHESGFRIRFQEGGDSESSWFKPWRPSSPRIVTTTVGVKLTVWGTNIQYLSSTDIHSLSGIRAPRLKSSSMGVISVYHDSFIPVFISRHWLISFSFSVSSPFSCSKLQVALPISLIGFPLLAFVPGGMLRHPFHRLLPSS